MLVWGLDAQTVTFIAAHSLHARPLVVARGSDVELLGPAPKPIARIQGAERWHILIRSGSRKALHGFLQKALPAVRERRSSGIRVTVDVDPRQVL